MRWIHVGWISHQTPLGEMGSKPNKVYKTANDKMTLSDWYFGAENGPRISIHPNAERLSTPQATGGKMGLGAKERNQRDQIVTNRMHSETYPSSGTRY
jgi:hypothetical protein